MENKTDYIDKFYNAQVEFQNLLGNHDVPIDDPERFAHHLLGLVTEVGEVAQADKRWKRNKRNDHYDKDEKLSEIADCFIFLLNIMIYSDIAPDEFKEAVITKIAVNVSRLITSLREEDNNDRNS